ncbi:MAG: ATP synthase F1 subunit delta [Dehalococcoidia bacterium]|nr:MAG: F-type H+-transporting ATPase subunit delta [Chloroflexota bacterium]
MLLRDVAGKRYALAIREIASKKNNFSAWSDFLNQLSEIYNHDSSQLLFTNNIEDKKFEKILQGIFKNISEDELNFLKLLKKKQRLQLINSINSYFNEIIDDIANVVRAEITTAIELDSKLSSIEQFLSKKINKNVILTSTKDENVIGGMKLRIGDRLFDGTIKTKLSQLKESLLESNS